MRDIIPSRDRRNSVRTPWTTYTDVTPKVSTQKQQRVPRSTSTRKTRTLRADVSSPSSDELPPHESYQLPRRLSSRRKKTSEIKKSPIDVIEDFIRDLPPEEKEAVRATYNGPDWPKSNPRMRKRTFVPPIVFPQETILHHQPIAFLQHAPPVPAPAMYYPQSMTCLDLSQRYSPQPHFISPPITPTPNRFLTYLSSQGTYPLGPVQGGNFFRGA